jgi:hypothetical protein
MKLRVLDILILICSAGGIIGEAAAIAFPDKILALLDPERQEEALHSRLTLVLGALSAVYMADVVLLFLSKDTVFILYGYVLVLLSLVVWAARPWFLRWRYLMTLESTLCLIMLIDVVRTIVERSFVR